MRLEEGDKAAPRLPEAPATTKTTRYQRESQPGAPDPNRNHVFLRAEVHAELTQRVRAWQARCASY